MIFTYQMLVKILVDKLGFVLLDGRQDDFAINEYVTDSVTFIKLIIAIEETIGKELTDDFLDYEMLSSAKGFAAKIDCFIDSSKDQ